ACRLKRNGNFAAARVRKRRFTLATRFLPSKRITMAISPMATVRKGFVGRKPRQSAVSQRMLLGFMTCTAMCGSGVRTGTVIIHKMTWLIRKVQKKVKAACCVAVRGSIVPGFAARLIVAGMSLSAVTATTVCVSVSAWTDYAFPFVLLPFAFFLFFFFNSSEARIRKKMELFGVLPRPKSVGYDNQASCRPEIITPRFFNALRSAAFSLSVFVPTVVAPNRSPCIGWV